MFTFDDEEERYTQFDDCGKLTTFDLVGGIHKTISHLSLQSWRNEMNQEINRINQVLPTTHTHEKAGLIILDSISFTPNRSFQRRALLIVEGGYNGTNWN